MKKKPRYKNIILNRPPRKFEKDSNNFFTKIILNPGIYIALITTLFGSIAVTLISREIASRELEHDVITNLMVFTKDAEFDNSIDILKLKAYIQLLKENEELLSGVTGFEDIINNFKADKMLLIETSRDSLSSILNNTNDSIVIKNKELSELQNEFDNTNISHINLRNKLQKEIENKKYEVNNATQDRDKYLEMYEKQSNELKEIKKQFKNAQTDIISDNDRINNLLEEKKSLISNIKTLSDANDSKQAKLHKLQVEVTALKNENSNYSLRIDRIQKELDKKTQNVNDVTQERDKYLRLNDIQNSQFTDLNNQLKEAKSEIEKYNFRISNLNIEKDSLISQINRTVKDQNLKQVDIQKLQLLIRNLENENKKHLLTIDSLQTISDKINFDNKELNKQIFLMSDSIYLLNSIIQHKDSLNRN